MNRRTLFAFASLSALALDGCLLNWNQFRPSDAAADVTSRPDAPAPDAAPDVVVVEDTGVPEDTGMSMDTGTPDAAVMDAAADTGVAMDARPDALPDAVADSRPDALPDAVADVVPAGDADPGCTGPVVVNEVQTYGMGGGTDEFVELLNTGTCEVSLNGWLLNYRPSSGSGVSTLYRFTAADRLPPGGYFLVYGAGFGDGGFLPRVSSGIADSAGIAVLDPMGRVVDSVSFGTIGLLPSPYCEPMSGPPATHRASVAMSVSRVPNGQDTNNNATDFRDSTPSPGLPNP